MPDKVGKTFVAVNKNQLLLGRTPRTQNREVRIHQEGGEKIFPSKHLDRLFGGPYRMPCHLVFSLQHGTARHVHRPINKAELV
jgi:hypothetical protein